MVNCTQLGAALERAERPSEVADAVLEGLDNFFAGALEPEFQEELEQLLSLFRQAVQDFYLNRRILHERLAPAAQQRS